ncbi:hypothetical protein C8_469 [Cannes 8 virus]|nr:hypothetical protein C8_469 [Cannes 8 virus]
MQDIEEAVAKTGTLGKVVALGVGLYCGFRTAVYASTAAFLLGPEVLGTFSKAPLTVAFAPWAYGSISAFSGIFFTNSLLVPWIWINYGIGALAGAYLVDKPKILLPLVVLFAAFSLASK